MNTSSIAQSKSKGKSRNSLFLSHESTYKGKLPRNSVFVPEVKITGDSPLKFENKKAEKSKLKSLDLQNPKHGFTTQSKILDLDDTANNDSFYNQMISKYCTPKPEPLPKKKKFLSKDYSLINPTQPENVGFKIIESVSRFEIPSKQKEVKLQKEVTSFELIPSSLFSLHSKNEPQHDFKMPSQLSSISLTPRKFDSNNQNIIRKSKVNFKWEDKLGKVKCLPDLKYKPQETLLNSTKVCQSCDEGKQNVGDRDLCLTVNNNKTNSKSKRVHSTKSKMRLWLCF